MRIRAAAVLIQNHALALIERYRDGKHYFTFPGGGVDSGETSEQAVVREIEEELGLQVRVLGLIAEVWFRGNRQLYYLVEQTGGVFGTGLGEEYTDPQPHNPNIGTYRPMWMPLKDVPVNSVLPAEVAALAVKSEQGGWPREPLVIFEEAE